MIINEKIQTRKNNWFFQKKYHLPEYDFLHDPTVKEICWRYSMEKTLIHSPLYCFMRIRKWIALSCDYFDNRLYCYRTMLAHQKRANKAPLVGKTHVLHLKVEFQVRKKINQLIAPISPLTQLRRFWELFSQNAPMYLFPQMRKVKTLGKLLCRGKRWKTGNKFASSWMRGKVLADWEIRGIMMMSDCVYLMSADNTITPKEFILKEPVRTWIR